MAGEVLRSAPMSFGQQRIWLLHELDRRGDLYNLQSGFRVRGSLDADTLQGALNALACRHEALRTTLSIGPDGARQTITATAAIPLARLDLRGTPEPRRGEEALRLSLEDARLPFVLSVGPLLRATLLRLQEDEHLLLLTIHHAVADGWSLGILARELGALYDASSRGLASKLAALPMQYADFAESQRAWLGSPQCEKQIAYWTAQLRGAPRALELPGDYARPDTPTRRGSRARIDLSADLTRALKALSAGNRASLFMTLLAAFEVLLARTSGESDLIVGTPVAGRTRRETQPLIGFFLNTLALRAEISGDLPFTEHLQRVRKVCLGGYAHQDLPFEVLLQHLGPASGRDAASPTSGRDAASPTSGGVRHPLFQVLVNVLDFAPPALELEGLAVETFDRPDEHSLFDLTLYVTPSAESLRLEVMYCVDLFSRARIDELLAQMRGLLEQVVEEPGRAVGALSLVTPGARKRLPDPRARLEATWGGSIVERFRAQARAHPEREAVVDPDALFRYGELDARSDDLAQLLLRGGVEREEVVAIHARRSACLVWALLGVLKAGAAFLILDASYPPARLAECVAQASPRALISIDAAGPVPELLERALAGAGLRVRVGLPSGCGAGQPGVALLEQGDGPRSGPDDIAYVAFTSGSTGRPKGIVGTHRPLGHFIDWQARTFELRDTDRFSMLSGLSHDPLLRDVFTPLCIGASLRVPDPTSLQDPTRLAEWMASQQITVCHLGPAMGEILVEGARGRELRALRLLFFGGDVLSRSLVARVAERAPLARVVSFYGATETPQAMAWFAPAADDRGAAVRPRDACPLGRGIDGVDLLVLRPDGELAGIGELGEIVVRTPYLARGYLADPNGENAELGSSAFLPDPSGEGAFEGGLRSPRLAPAPGASLGSGPSFAARLYRTGDLGRYLPDGSVEFAGRRDHQVKIRGFRVELREIEVALSSHPAIRDAVVTPRDDDGEAGRRLVAYWTPREAGAAPRDAELRQHLRSTLPEHMVPSMFVELDELPRTPNGKVDRRALPAPRAPAATVAPSPSPKTPREEQLATIWREVLGIERSDAGENFFDLGGNSLLVIKLVARIRSELGCDVPVASLFEVGTLEHLSESLRSAPTSRPLLVPLRTAGDKPALFLFHTLRGDAADYYELASSLAPDQPLYATRAVGIEAGEEALTDIEAMASSCLAEIRRVQPEGPYRLGGYSVGGLIAFEAAQQLRSRGEEVALLALFDTGSPNHAGRPRIRSRSRTAGALGAHAPIEALLDALPSWVRQDPIVRGVDPRRQLHVMGCILLAASRYMARPYEGMVTFFVASGKRRGLGSLLSRNVDRWTCLAPALEVHPIPGKHGTIFSAPQVEGLARELTACLARCVSGQPSAPLPPSLHERIARRTRKIQIERSSLVIGLGMWLIRHPGLVRYLKRDPNAYIPTPDEFLAVLGRDDEHDR